MTTEHRGQRPGQPGEDGRLPTPAQRATIHDVARLAGVSNTTVSNALSGLGRVSERTRLRIKSAAEELGYSPSSTARHLRRGRLGAIGLYLPQMNTSVNYYTQFTFGCLDRAHEAGYDLTLVAPVGESVGTTPPRVDGIIMIDPLPGDGTTRQLADAGLPFVSGERPLLDGATPVGVVRVDHQEVITAVLDHLHERGARMPVLLAPDAGTDWDSSLRRGYASWCERSGVPPLVATVDFDATPDQITAMVAAVLADNQAVDAIVCAPDEAALGVASAAAASGRTIGENLLLAACVDSPSMEWANPRITAVNLHPRQFGQACADLLIDVLEQRTTAGAVRRQEFELVVRESTGGYAGR